MSIRSEIREALKSAADGMTMQQLFEACESADDEKSFASTISTLKAQQRIKVVSTTDEDKPRSIYGLDNWPGAEEPKSDKPKPANGAVQEPKKKRAKRATTPAPVAPKADLTGCDAQFAMNAAGELGIEKGEAKLRLAANEFAVLRDFIERTEEVWGR
jgi:hypothetical protein